MSSQHGMVENLPWHATFGGLSPDSRCSSRYLDTNLIPSDHGGVAVVEMAKSDRHFVDGHATLSEQINYPQASRCSQQASMKSGNTRIGEPKFTTAG